MPPELETVPIKPLNYLSGFILPLLSIFYVKVYGKQSCAPHMAIFKGILVQLLNLASPLIEWRKKKKRHKRELDQKEEKTQAFFLSREGKC